MSDNVEPRGLSLLVSPFVRQVGAFLLVGGVGWIIDVSVFNLLRSTVFDPAHVQGGALYAKIVSTCVAIAANWVGNRYLAFRSGRGRAVLPEALRFVGASLLGSSVSLLCLVVSHDLMGLTSAAADNLSANVIGLGIGTLLRFALYRAWVFVAPKNRVEAA